jgi:hypothetical protein
VKAYADIPSEFEQKAKLVLRSKQVLGQVFYIEDDLMCLLYHKRDRMAK